MSLDLRAPHYQPATAFHQPSPAAVDLTVDAISIEELVSAPATREILAKNAPWALQMANSEGFAPFRSTFTVRDAATFVPVDMSKSVEAVDAALRSLPRTEWPASVR